MRRSLGVLLNFWWKHRDTACRDRNGKIPRTPCQLLYVFSTCKKPRTKIQGLGRNHFLFVCYAESCVTCIIESPLSFNIIYSLYSLTALQHHGNSNCRLGFLMPYFRELHPGYCNPQTLVYFFIFFHYNRRPDNDPRIHCHI